MYVRPTARRVWVDAGLKGEGFITEMNPGVTGLNYQRLKEGLLKDFSYAELEEAYAAKTDFACTASFSSLLFYEKRSLRNGGFFMRSPLQVSPDLTDFGFALVADIACAVWEQLRRLIEISGLHPDHIKGCGGGLRSDALCTMIASLSGMEIRCPKGFEQATLLGLVKICNGALGEPEGGCDAVGEAEGAGTDACGAATKGCAGEAGEGTTGGGCIGSNIITRGGERIIRPAKGHLIEKYYPVWLKNRMNANP